MVPQNVLQIAEWCHELDEGSAVGGLFRHMGMSFSLTIKCLTKKQNISNGGYSDRSI